MRLSLTSGSIAVCDGCAQWPVRVYDRGVGPVVVLLHGFMQNGSTWDEVACSLSERFRVVAPDVASLESCAATLECLADGVHDVVRWATGHFAVDAVGLVGYSMGGRIALNYARRYPQSLYALVLESAGVGPETEEARGAVARRNHALAQRIDQAADMDEVVDYWQDLPLFATQKKLSGSVRQAIRQQRLACDRAWLARIAWDAGAHTMPLASETRDMLQRAAVPVLYVAGRADAKYRAVAQTLCAVGVETVLLAGGHNVHLEDSVEYTQCVAAFFGRAASLCSNEKDKA